MFRFSCVLVAIGAAYNNVICSILCSIPLLLCVRAGTPAPALFYDDQVVDHVSPRPSQYWTQRYYVWDKHFQGPGSPIFLILGGEGAIEPSTGLMYPFVTHHLAANFGAFVLQPEHRFYGESRPITAFEIDQARNLGLPDPRIQLLTYEQALLDALRLLDKTRFNDLGCSRDRFSPLYCPVITVGGSYPGFLSAMARIMYPHVIDMAYSASAPMLLYAQTVSQDAYYERITQVAEAAVPGCAHAVQSTLLAVTALFHNTSQTSEPPDIGACQNTVPEYCRNDPATYLDEVIMMVAYTFANFNMAYYPPMSPSSRLHQACRIFIDETNPHSSLRSSPLERLRTFLVMSLGQDVDASRDSTTRTSTLDGTSKLAPSCFNMSAQLPTGVNATISGGDWSGIGTGTSGESWDFQTCTLCVEAIGMNSSVTMFPNRPWSLDWLTRHCQARFGRFVVPQPLQLRYQWHIDDLLKTNASRILFTNGLNDGWSVSGIQHNLSDTLLALNFVNGAHHSDLSGKGPSDDDTDDIRLGFVQIRTILADWLNQVQVRAASE